MGDEVAIGLVIQLVAVLLLFAKLGRSWHRHLGAIFILMAVLYHGVGEVLIHTFPGYDPYRPLVGAAYVDRFVLLVSITILLFTLVYIGMIGPRPAEQTAVPDELGAATTIRFFDYRLMALATVPLLLLTVSGQGYGSNGGTQGGGVAATLGLSQQYFIIGIVLTGFGLVVHFGRKWAVWVLIAQSVLLALVGQRVTIAVGAVILVFLLSQFGIRLRARAIFLGAIVILLAGWGITAARGAEGRFNTTAGATSAGVRASYLTTGLRNLFSSTTRYELAFTLGYRLDGNSYGGMELEALENGSRPIGAAPLKNDLVLAIPSFLDPTKDLGNPADRVEKIYVEENLPIPELLVANKPGLYLDILPTDLGSLLGIFGSAGILIIGAVLGVGFALLDRWLRRGRGPSRTLISIGVLYCVLEYEGSWDTWTTTLRGILLLVGIVGVVLSLRWVSIRKPEIQAAAPARYRPRHVTR